MLFIRWLPRAYTITLECGHTFTSSNKVTPGKNLYCGACKKSYPVISCS